MKNVLVALASAGVTSLWWCVGTIHLNLKKDEPNNFIVAGVITSVLLIVWLTMEAQSDGKL